MTVIYALSFVVIIFNITKYFLNYPFTIKNFFKISFMQIIFVILCVLCAFLMAKLENIISGNNDGYFSLFGLILFLPALIYLLCRIFKIKYCDFYDFESESIILIVILMRLNCIYKGCCLGKIATSFDGRYPTREVEIALNTIYLAFYFIFKNKIKKGMSYPIYMIFYGIVRFIIQFYRSYDGLWGTNIAFGHIWSIVSIVVGIITLVILHFRNKKEEGARPQ